jgi:hypothetical protein
VEIGLDGNYSILWLRPTVRAARMFPSRLVCVKTEADSPLANYFLPAEVSQFTFVPLGAVIPERPPGIAGSICNRVVFLGFCLWVICWRAPRQQRSPMDRPANLLPHLLRQPSVTKF